MRKFCLFLSLYACLCLLASCGSTSDVQTPDQPSQDGSSTTQPTSALLAEDETPTYLACRIVDGAEDGDLLLASLDSSLYEGHPVLEDSTGVYRLSVAGVPVYLDGKKASPEDLRDGMPVEVACNGDIMESFPAQLGEVYSVSAWSIGTRQSPGGTCYDLCGLYLQVLDDLWERDSGLNSDITIAGLDLSQAPGMLSESETSAIAWRFGELHGVEVVQGTFDELLEQGYFTSSAISTPAPEEGEDFRNLWYQWEDGCLFTIRENKSREDAFYSLPCVFFDAEKWRSPRGAYFFDDCSAIWGEQGTWSGYTIGGEMIS